ncbi:hypothetical protein C3L33_00045, partial [Rhododendron williamsianum]
MEPTRRMGGEGEGEGTGVDGWRAREESKERARELAVMARQAVEKGGSSDRKLDKLIESLTGRDKKGV